MDQDQRNECGEVKESEVNSRKRARKPNWLEELLNVKFFKSCAAHQELRKNETNMFCTECVRRICHHCLPRHTLHDTLQVRKYVYQDVVRLRDIQKHLDCSQVQSYSINSSKAVFLNPRPQTKPPKPLGSECVTCGRSLQAPYRYCSIACKVSSSTPSPPPEKEDPDVKCEEVARSEVDVRVSEEVTTSEVDAKPSEEVATNDVNVRVGRKSRRKGFPCRSPLR